MSGASASVAAAVDLVAIEVPIRLCFTSLTRDLVPAVLAGWADLAACEVDPGSPRRERTLILAAPGEVVTPYEGAPAAKYLDEGASAAESWAHEPQVLRVHEQRAALTDLAARITMAALDARGGELMLLHGCAVADPRTGAVAAFVAPSGTGKTTLARTLARNLAGTLAGEWSYVTDETVAFGLDLRVVAYPKPLSLIEPGYASGTKTQRSASALGLPLAPAGRLRLTALSLLERRPGWGVEVEELDTLEALAALAPESSHLARFATPLRDLASVVTAVGPVRRIRYAEAADLAAMVGGLLAGSAGAEVAR